jgi:hypothetical protein
LKSFAKTKGSFPTGENIVVGFLQEKELERNPI